LKKGFTITELIVVITVIGILASIVIVSYNGVRDHANDSSVQSDLDSTAGLLESHRVSVSTAHKFPSTAAELTSLDIRITRNAYNLMTAANFVYCADTSDYQAYSLVGLSKSGKAFVMTEEGFKSSSLTKDNFTSGASVCTALGQSLVSSGMSAPDTWQTWVGNS
jgi:prepilin-type N-terminal cleavage/methylation domain-containing protein